MNYEFLTEDDYDFLPEEPSRRWVSVERKARQKLASIEAEYDESVSLDTLRTEYMAIVASAAEELGVEGVRFPYSENINDAYFAFVRDVRIASTKIMLRESGKKDPTTVGVSNAGKEVVRSQIRILEREIRRSGLAKTEVEELLGICRTLERELDRPRIRIGYAIRLLGKIGGAYALGATAIVATPQAIGVITSVLGAEKSAEIDSVPALSYPDRLLALPPPEDFPVSE